MTGPDTGGKSEFGIVRELNSLLVAVECSDGQKWTEGFFLHHAHLRSDIGEYGRRVEVRAEFGEANAALQNMCAMLYGVFNLGLNNSQLSLMDERSNISIGIHAVANAKALRFLDTGVQKLRVETAMNVAAFDRKTGLSRVDKSSPNRTA